MDYSCLTVLFTVILTLVTLISSSPIFTEKNAVEYLSRFGYMGISNSLFTNKTNLYNEALEGFQKFAGLSVSGELDDETVRTMSLARCGNIDQLLIDGVSRKPSLRWNDKTLTYRISKYPNRYENAHDEVDAEIARAFAVWSEYTDLIFLPTTSGYANIDIRFVENEHRDGDAFDGVGGTLTHTSFPILGRDVHFDDAEIWTIGSGRGTNLFQVAVHMFGHSLGLSHSNERSSVMSPFYRGYDPNFSLHINDILDIQALYGKKNANNSSNIPEGNISCPGIAQLPRSPKLPSEDSICQDPKVDAMFKSAEGQIYAFKGNNYYKIDEFNIARGYPLPISEGWPGLPGNIDAAFTYKNGKTYFFKGTKYWRYNGRHMDGDYPKEISEGFTGIPDHVDAAASWEHNGRIYFFKDSQFWRFEPSAGPPVSYAYPKPISNWKNLPNNLDAALGKTSEYTYFFKGDKYYRFNNNQFEVDNADPPFPRPSTYWWFQCTATEQAELRD